MKLPDIGDLLGKITHEQLSKYLHIFFWFSYSGLLIGGLYYILPLSVTVIRTAIHILLQMAMVYLHFKIILPRYFDKHNLSAYLRQSFLVILVISILRALCDHGVAYFLLDIPLFGPTEAIAKKEMAEQISNIVLNISNAKDGLRKIMLVYSSYYLQEFLHTPDPFIRTFASSLLIFVLTLPIWFFDRWQKQQQAKQEIENQKLEAELKFLKTQIHPHFLFNTLNNIYTLFIVGSEKAASMILKLSEMMRYMLYECNENKMALIQEIQYLRNYISLQQLKTATPQQIDFEVKGYIHQVEIPPLLFVPLFENAFKHGNVENVKEGWLKAMLTVEDNQLSFEIHNSVPENKVQMPQGGIGLENLKQRLALIYPDKYTFSVKSLSGSYSVLLNIDLS